MIRRFLDYLNEHPLIFGFGGTGTSIGLDFLNVMGVVANILKDIGIIAGALLSIISLIVYVNRNLETKKKFPFIRIKPKTYAKTV